VILADTSVWIDHLRHGDPALAASLEDAQIVVHPYVVGELALGSLKNRATLLKLLSDLPQALVASHSEILELIERRSLFGLGLGYVDAHLIASALLSAGTRLWTRDRRLHEAALSLGLAPDRTS
jgi:predicted nucleic acid-binding protein